MRKALFLLATLAIVSCQKPTVDYAVVSGKILNYNYDKIFLISVNNATVSKIQLNKDGSFSDTLKVTPQQHILKLRNSRKEVTIYVKKGSNVNIEFDANNFLNTLAVTGTDQVISSYLKAKLEQEHSLLGEKFDFFKNNDEVAFKEKSAKLKSQLVKLINSMSDLPVAFKAYELRNIQYEYLNRLLSYESSHRILAGLSEFNVSEGFLDELERLDYNNSEDFKNSDAYFSLIQNHLSSETRKLKKTKSLNSATAQIEAFKNIESIEIRNFFLYDYGSRKIDYMLESAKAYYDANMQVSTNDQYKKEIHDLYTKRTKQFAKGSPSPKFENYVNYAGGTTSLDDLKGKYLWYNFNGYLVLKTYISNNSSKYSLLLDKRGTLCCPPILPFFLSHL